MAKHKRLKPIGDYLYDKGEVIEQMFSSIPIVEIRNMVPIKLQGMPLHELKAECLVELLGISDREILNILDGKKERNDSSSDSEQGGAFVISDEERKIYEKRIKKEKKDTGRKIKTERVSSKKDGNSRNSPEPSTSKKKRKSKEVVEVNSKKKKSDDKSANVPPSSKDASKVPVCKKKKDKKGDKKKDSPKRKEDEEIVVLDDDSDKEEKREQKSLLDLLELEMRARAIRSLLKKEEAVQAEKILREYKDEPDDLIPIDIEPPHIELISDSEGEETNNVIEHRAQKNTSTEERNESISLKKTEDSLQSFEDQKHSSRSPPVGPSDDHNSVSFAGEKPASSDVGCRILNNDAAKLTSNIEVEAKKRELSVPSPVVTEYCRHNEVSITNASINPDDSFQSTVSGDIISAKAGKLPCSSGSASQFSSVSDNYSTVPEGKTFEKDGEEQDASKTDSVSEKNHCTSSSTQDSRNEVNTSHFLAIEEPSVIQMTGGSQIEESTVKVNYVSTEIVKTCSNFGSDDDKKTCSIENVSLTVQEVFQRSNVVENSPVHSNSNLAIQRHTVENLGSEFIEPSPEESSTDCDIQLKGYSGCLNTNLALHTLTDRRESIERTEEDLHLKYEEEFLDYDYVPVNSCSAKGSKANITPSENSPSCAADNKASSLGNNIGPYYCSSVSYSNSNDDRESEGMLNELGDTTHEVSDGYGVVEPKPNSSTDGPENSAEHVNPSGDVTSVSIHLPLEEAAFKNGSLSETQDCILRDDTSQQSSLKDDPPKSPLETIKLQVASRPNDFSSNELLKDAEPMGRVLLPMSEPKFDDCVQENYLSNEANDDLSKKEAGTQNSLDCNVAQSIYLYAEERRSFLNLEPHGVVDKDECPIKETVSEKLAGFPEQNQMATEQDSDLLLPGFNSNSTQSKTTHHEVTGDSLVLDKKVSHLDKDMTPLGSSVCVGKSGHAVDSNDPMIQHTTATTNSKQDEKNMQSKPCLSLRSNNDLDLFISTAICKQSITIPEDHNLFNTCVVNLSPKTNNEMIEEGQIPEYPNSSVASSTVDTSISTSLSVLDHEVLSKGGEMVDGENAIEGTKTLENHISTLESNGKQQPSPQGVMNVGFAEIIDITECEHVDSSEVIFVSEERVDSDSVDESDNEISHKGSLILEKMNSILNNDIDRVSTSGESCQPSPHATEYVPAEVYTVNSDITSSEPETDDERGDDGSPDDKGYTTVLEVSDLDDAGEEETQDKGSNDSNDGNGGSCNDCSIEIIDDSESVCSVQSQRDDSKSNDCVKVLKSQVSISDDCIIITEPETSKNSNFVLSTESDGSDSDDCTIVSQYTDTVIDESVRVSDRQVPRLEATDPIPKENPSTTDKDSVMVTIIIEDDDGEEEEVQLLTEEVPAEILELEDDNEAKTNWTTRWLESDNVKKVVKTSKILTNVRKLMKMKLKKIEAPSTKVLDIPEEKSAPPLIGSVEEYHRLVKEGVIFSKATQNAEKTESLNNSIEDSVDPSKEAIGSVPAESKVKERHEKKSDKEKNEKNKEPDDLQRKKKRGKSERKRFHKNHKKKSKSSVLSPILPELSSPGITETDTCSKVNGKCEVLAIADSVVEDAVQEAGEIIESPKIKVANSVGVQKEENGHNEMIMSNVGNDRVCRIEQNIEKDVDEDDHEEGETSEKEEGELSDSDGDNKSQKSSQPEPSSLPVTAIGSKECSRSESPLSSIPLPRKPPNKPSRTPQQTSYPKQQLNKTPTKNPDRNSAAKRFIIRNLQLGKKRPANAKNKRKKKKGGRRGNKKGIGYSLNPAPKKNKPTSLPKMKGTYKKPLSQTELVSSFTSSSSAFQSLPGSQPSYQVTYSGLPEQGSSMSQLGQAPNTSVNVSNTAQMHDSYYSWAYSQGLINSANSNYGYGTHESTPDPNVYKQWEEYYRKLMEACKVSAEHASAGTLYNVSSTSTTEKSGYTWVFDHSTSAPQTGQMQTSEGSTAEPAVQVQTPIASSETSEASGSVAPVTNEMSDKDRFESWQYHYGLKGLLKEHFISAPTAPSAGDGSQNVGT